MNYIIKSKLKKIIFPYIPNFFILNKKLLNENVGICTLLCHEDVTMFEYCMISFSFFLKGSLPIYVIDDGTLTKKDYSALSNLLNAKVVKIQDNDDYVNDFYGKYKFIEKFRFDAHASPLRKKLDAIFLNPFRKFIYIDSDILFYKKPQELLTWINDDFTKENLYSGHQQYPINFFGNEIEMITNAYRSLLLKKFSTTMSSSFNSGLLCVNNKKDFDLTILNDTLEYFYKNSFIYHKLVEEIALSLSAKSNLFKLLPTKKYINVWGYEEYKHNVGNQKIVIHYSFNEKKDFFVSDAIKLARENNYFRTNKYVLFQN